MVPEGLITRTDGSLETIEGWGELAVPFPRERRILKRRFEVDSSDGDRLHIREPRWALDDLHFLKRGGELVQVDRDEFFSASDDSVSGVEMDSQRHTLLLAIEGASMLKRSDEGMIFAIEFPPQYFKAEQLRHLRFLPNIEQIQLSDTTITDDDLKWLVDLPRLNVVALNKTAITDRGVEITFRLRFSTNHSGQRN